MAPNNAILRKKNSVIRLIKSASNKYYFLTVITTLSSLIPAVFIPHHYITGVKIVI